jgi:hypothetical protein
MSQLEYIDESDAYEQFDMMLDELYPDQIGNILASTILKNLDPIAYQCEFNDWLDACDLTIDESELEEV